MCAGKSTLSKAVVAQFPSFMRLSINALVYQSHGLWAIDYPADRYSAYQLEAKELLVAKLGSVLQEKQRDVVLDLSFYNKEYWDEFKRLVEKNGGRWVLIFLDADRDLLWRRIGQRRAQRDALDVTDKGRNGDSAFDIDENTFKMYWEGFERPDGEGKL
ncbi:hypothetical protein QQX98_002298 [Neonectria punicea]|uniref:ATP/GTP-binding protein n=1 Tax=Neonectria punicea TaxID=979145 RepID=A0ABR1HJK8_9HYPO